METVIYSDGDKNSNPTTNMRIRMTLHRGGTTGLNLGETRND